MTKTMLAGVSSPNGLKLTELPLPNPGPGQVRVKVAAAGMNRADLNAAKGAGVAAPGSLGTAIGMEWAGEIDALGAGVTGLKLGELVMCSGTGGYAEYALCDARRAIPIEGTGLTLTEAATLPLVLMTAHNALMTQGRFVAGDHVLVAGAASAVGLMAMQIAAAKGAGSVIALARDPAKRDRLAGFGATHSLDPKAAETPNAVLTATGGKGADCVIDMVSGAGFNALMAMTAIRGRIVNVGRLGGASAEFDFDLHAARRIDYSGVTFRTRSPDEVAEIIRQMKADLWEGLAQGKFRLPIDHHFALSDAAAAHALMSTNAHFGKIVLRPDKKATA